MERSRSWRLGALRRTWVAAVAAASVCISPLVADAFVLVGKEKESPSDGATVVLLREAGHTVVSVQMRVRDKAGEVALLIPVPAALDTKALRTGTFLPLAEVSGPRVAEYWEQDPCEFHPLVEPPTPSPGEPPSEPNGSGAAPTAAGDYTVEVLEGKSADVLEAVRKQGFTLSPEIEPVLAGYVDAGMKLVVAKFDAAKLEGKLLPPLLVHYESNELALPTRLFAAGGGRRTLDLYVLAPGHRFEAEHQPNLAVPTNLDIKAGVRPKLASFYDRLLDRALEEKPGTVITEYAWRASTCELCPAPLSPTVVADLGGALLPSAKQGKQHEVLIDAEKVSSEPGGPDAMRSSLEACYAKVLAEKPGVQGKVSVEAEVANGAVSSAKVATSDPAPDESLAACAVEAVKGASLETTGAVGIEFSSMSRKFFGDLVLTKLRARYETMPEKDLALRAARAIEGGREAGPEGKPEKKVYWAEATNNYQPRYVVRHAFKGPVKCDSPERGVWGPAPKDWKAPAGGGNVDLKKVEAAVDGKMPDFAAFAIEFAAPPPPPPTPTPSASAPTSPVPPPSASAAPAAAAPVTEPGGCGCRTAHAGTATSALGASSFVLALLAVRRRRRRVAP